MQQCPRLLIRCFKNRNKEIAPPRTELFRHCTNSSITLSISSAGIPDKSSDTESVATEKGTSARSTKRTAERTTPPGQRQGKRIAVAAENMHEEPVAFAGGNAPRTGSDLSGPGSVDGLPVSFHPPAGPSHKTTNKQTYFMGTFFSFIKNNNKY